MKRFLPTLLVAVVAALLLGATAYRQHAAQRQEQLYFMQSCCAPAARAWFGTEQSLRAPSEEPLAEIATDLRQLHTLLSVGRPLVDDRMPDPNWGAPTIDSLASYLDGGIYEGEPPFFVLDGTLTEREQRFLRVLHEDLGVLLTSITGEDGLNLNEQLSVEEFTAAWQTFFAKWSARPIDSPGASWLAVTA